MAVIGNLDGIVQLSQGIWSVVQGNVAGMVPFDFWRSSRMLPVLDSVDPGPLTFWLWGANGSQAEASWHITEFPLFSFLFADLHAHMMAIPFIILVIGLGLNLFAGFRRLGWIWDLAAVVMLAFVLGSLWTINSWDYPSFLLLTLALIVLVSYRTWNAAGWQLTGGLFLAASVAVVSVLGFPALSPGGGNLRHRYRSHPLENAAGQFSRNPRPLPRNHWRFSWAGRPDGPSI